MLSVILTIVVAVVGALWLFWSGWLHVPYRHVRDRRVIADNRKLMSGLIDRLDKERQHSPSSGHPFSSHHLARDHMDPPRRLALAIQRRGLRFEYFESLLCFRPFNDSDPPLGGPLHAGGGGNTEVGRAYREALVATESNLPNEPGLYGNTMDEEERRIFDTCFDEFQARFRGEIAVAAQSRMQHPEEDSRFHVAATLQLDWEVYPWLPVGMFPAEGEFETGYFAGIDCAGENLSGANCVTTTFSRANLTGTDLTNTNFWGSVLIDANLAGANLAGANLTGANLTGANLSKALADANTLWPTGFDPDAAGVIFE